MHFSRKTLLTIGCIGLGVFAAQALQAADFRRSTPIQTPDGAPRIGAPALQGNANPVTNNGQTFDLNTLPEPRREDVIRIIRSLISKWNTPDFGSTLDSSFYKADRLVAKISNIYPVTARMTPESVGGLRILNPRLVSGQPGDPIITVHYTVQADVNLLVTYTDPKTGTVTRRGSSEFTFEIRQDYRR